MTWKALGLCDYTNKGPTLCADLDGSLRATAVVDPRWPDNTPYISDGYLNINAACPPGLTCLECPDPCASPCATDTLAISGTSDTIEVCKGDPCPQLNTTDGFGHAITFTTNDPGPEMPYDFWHCTDCGGSAKFNDDTKRWQYCKCGPADDCPDGMATECADAIALWEATPDGKSPTLLPKVEIPGDAGNYAVLVPHCQAYNLPDSEQPSYQVTCTGPASDPADGGPGACCSCLCNEITVTLNAGVFYLSCNEGKSKAGTAICEYEDVTNEEITNEAWSTTMPYRGVITVAAGEESARVCGWYNCTLRYATNPLYSPSSPICDPMDGSYDPTSIYCQETIDIGCANKDNAYNHGDVIGTGTNSEIRIEAAFVTAPISGVISNNYSGQSPQDGKNLRDFVTLVIDVGCYPVDQKIPFCNCWGLLADATPGVNCTEGVDPNLPGTCYEAGVCAYDESGNTVSFTPRNDGSATPTCCYCAGDITEGNIVFGSGRCAPDIVEISCTPLVNYCGGPDATNPTNTICEAMYVTPPPGVDVNCIDLECAGRDFEEGVNDILISGKYYGAGKGATVREICVGGTCMDDPCNHVELQHPWERCIGGGVIDTRIINRTCPDYQYAVPDGSSYKCVDDPAWQVTATSCTSTLDAQTYLGGLSGPVVGADCIGGFAAGYNAICAELGGCAAGEVPMTMRDGDGSYKCYCAPYDEPADPANCGKDAPGSVWLELFGCKPITAPAPCAENFSAVIYSPPPGVRPDQWSDGSYREMPYTQYPGYNWPRHDPAPFANHSDWGTVCASTACVNVECAEGEMCTGLGCQEIPPAPDTFRGCCSSSSIKLSGDNTVLIDLASKLVFGQDDGFSGAEIGCIKTEAKMMAKGHSEADIGARVNAAEQRITFTEGTRAVAGITIKYPDGRVETINAKINVNGKPARMVEPPKIEVTTTTMARLKATPTRKPCPDGDCGDAPEKYDPPIPSQIEIERNRPGFFQKAKNLASTLARTGLKMIDQAERDRRLSICQKCDYIDPASFECRHPECGCPMTRKAWLKRATCPIGKW